MTDKTVKARYSALERKRDPFLRQARRASKLTIPSLVPPDSHSGHDTLPTPYQSVGSQGVNTLSNKYLLALFPPNEPFFRLGVDDYTLEQLTEDPESRAEVEEALNRIERTAMSYLESLTGFRATLGEVFNHLLVAGNVLLYVDNNGEEDEMRMFSLDSFVARRDSVGNVLEIIAKESISLAALPEATREQVREELKSEHTDSDYETEVDLYTRIYLEDKKFHVYQEAKDVEIEGSRGAYKKNECPWIVLRNSKIDGEDYGRGYVETFMGDLRSLEALTKAIVQGSAAAAKVLFLVNPNGSTKKETITKSESGDVKAGNRDDIGVLQLDKQADFAIAERVIDRIERRLSRAFMLNTSAQRNGERVTAEEIRAIIQEIEDTFSGSYSARSQDLQVPIVRYLLRTLQKRNKIPKMPQGALEPKITAGIDALGRGHDLQKLDAFIQGARDTWGDEVLATWVDPGDYFKRRGTSLGLDTRGLVRTQQQVDEAQQQEQEAAQQQQMTGQAMEGGMDVITDMAKGAMSGQ